MPHDDLSLLHTQPRDFLKMNLLVMRGILPTVAGMYNFQLTNQSSTALPEQARFHASRKSKFFFKRDHEINVWVVRHVQGRGAGTAAFHLPYRPNSNQRAMLPNDAPLMFTSEMTGCTFGVARYRNGSVEVCHANYQTEEGRLDVGRLSQETAFCTSRLEDHRYRGEIRGRAMRDEDRQAAMGATIIGVNRPRSGWKLYAQLWENVRNGEMLYHELIEV